MNYLGKRFLHMGNYVYITSMPYTRRNRLLVDWIYIHEECTVGDTEVDMVELWLRNGTFVEVV